MKITGGDFEYEKGYEAKMHHLEVFHLERTAGWNEYSLTNMLVECARLNTYKNIQMEVTKI